MQTITYLGAYKRPYCYIYKSQIFQVSIFASWAWIKVKNKNLLESQIFHASICFLLSFSLLPRVGNWLAKKILTWKNLALQTNLGLGLLDRNMVSTEQANMDSFKSWIFQNSYHISATLRNKSRNLTLESKFILGRYLLATH